MRTHTRSRLFGVAGAVVACATLLASGLSAQAAATTRYVLAGNVRGADDSRLSGAIVETLGRRAGTLHASTGSDGGFRFADLDAGALTLRVRRVGFRPETLQVEVPQVDGGAVVVPLERVAVPLPGVVVRAQGGANAAMTPFVAFERRRAAGLGRFVTRTDIDKTAATAHVRPLSLDGGPRARAG